MNPAGRVHDRGRGIPTRQRAQPGPIDLEDRALVWWARDDRGNHYLGHWEGSRADEAVQTGTLAFSPALDPLAKRVELLPTGRCQSGDLVPVQLGERGAMTDWWVVIAPAEHVVPCAGEDHHLRWEQGRLVA